MASTNTAETTTDQDQTAAQTNNIVYPLTAICSAVQTSALVSSFQLMMDDICYLIAEYVMEPKPIAIHYKTMLFNITKTGYTEADGTYGIANLFDKDRRTYCSGGDSGNCVDILVDLQHEYVLSALTAHSPGRWSFTCPLEQVYLWVFNARMNQDEVKEMATALFSKQTFEPLDTKITVIDAKTKERKRDEQVPVVYIEQKCQRDGWKKRKAIPDYIKGRYIMFKLIADGHSNVDARFVGVSGYRI